MKKVLLFPVIAVLAMITSCNDDNDKTSFPDETATYEGSLSIDTMSIILQCDVRFDQSFATCDITINDMKFAPAMPPITIEISDIACNIDNEGVAYVTADTITPVILMNGNALPGSGYMIRDLNATISGSNLRFTASIGSMGELSFDGYRAVTDTDTQPSVTPSDSTENIMPGDSITAEVITFRFNGMLDVMALDSSRFICDDVKGRIVITPSNNSCDLYILGAKFAEKMPVGVNILLENVQCRDNGGTFSFYITDVATPKVEMPGGNYIEMSEYNFDYLSGTTTNESMTFFAEMTKGSFSYSSK